LTEDYLFNHSEMLNSVTEDTKNGLLMCLFDFCA